MLPSHPIKKHTKASYHVHNDSGLSPSPATVMPKESGEAITASETRWKFALEASGDGVWDWNPITDEAFFSEQLLKILGYEDGKFVDNMSDCSSMIHPEEFIHSQPAIIEHLKGETESYWCEHRMKHKQGHWIWLLSRGMVVSRDENGVADRMVGTVTDITKQKEAEALVWRQANIDMLTGLPNRRLFHAQLKQAITDCRLQLKGCVALMLLDLDNFKIINDTHGHQYGDLLLEEAAKRLSTCVGENDLAARLGGDEFTVILKNVAEKNDITAVANHILEVLAKPFVINQGTFHVSASIGITCYPHDASDIDELIMNADQAMYNSKYLGRNCYSYFSCGMRTAAQQRMHSINELHKAFREEQLEVYYQPIINFKTGLIVKAECLLRWNHPTRNLLGADHIIPLAEETGLIVEIGNWIFKKSIAQLAHWRKTYAPTLQISINTSPVQYQHDECVVSEWYGFMDQLGLSYDCLVVEITENITLDLNNKVNGKLEALRNGGVQLALDDFGTGFSSLSYLKELDSHYLKIDRSFVNSIVESKKSRALCLEIIRFAQIFDMKIVAEGIETQDQAELLSTGGCDFGQGYLYSRPLPADQFETLLKKQPFHQKTPVINESVAVPAPPG